MKKLIICGLTLEIGGTERVISVLSKEFLNYFSEVEILLFYDRKICYKIDSRIKLTIVEKYTNTTNKLINALWIRKYIRKQDVIILSFMASNNVMILIATLGLDKKVVVSERSDPKIAPKNRFVRYIRNKIYKYADTVVLQTNETKKYFDKYSNVKKYAIIPNPTSVPDIKKGLALRTKKEDVIVCVGRIIRSKNYEMTLEVFKEFIKIHNTFKLKIFGDGNYKNEIENFIKKLNLVDKVFLMGNSKNVLKDIASARIYLSTSNIEGMSNALIEAMCIGLPVVVSKTLGVTDLVKNEINGVYYDIEDKEKCLKLLYDLANDEKYAKKLGEKAIRLVDVLSVEKIVKMWISILIGV